MASMKDISALSRQEHLYAIRKAERFGLIAAVAAMAGFPLSLIGIGLFLGIAGIVFGILAKRPNGSRPGSAIVAWILGAIDIIIGIPGCVIFYGVAINPHSEGVQQLVNKIVEMIGVINLW